MIRYKVVRGVVAGALISLSGGLATVSAGGTVSAQAGAPLGYAYICDGPTQVKAIKEYSGDQVVLIDRVERPNSPNSTFEIFQASRPEKCADMAAPATGALPGTLLVAVTWATPDLSVVRSATRGPGEHAPNRPPSHQPLDVGAPTLNQ